MTTQSKLNPAALAHFTGTERWYQHGLVKRITYTDGAKFVADEGGAYWLLDEIALSNVAVPAVQHEEFQVWKLVKNQPGGSSAILRCEDGNDNIVFSKEITFTDFPLDQIALWFNGGVIMLPSEY